jgi:hypothetical protein
MSTHTVPNQATPTSVPEGHPDIKCQSPVGSVAGSDSALNFSPRHAEKRDSRSFRDTEPQAIFHGLAGSLAGHLMFHDQRRINAPSMETVRWVANLELNYAETDVECRLEQLLVGARKPDGIQTL